MRNKAHFVKWITGFVGGIPIGALSYYLLFHVGLGIQITDLVRPFIELTLLLLLLAPLFYYFLFVWTDSGGGYRPLFILTGAWGIISARIVVNHATDLGFLDADTATGIFWSAVIGTVPAALFIAPYIHSKLFKKE